MAEVGGLNVKITADNSSLKRGVKDSDNSLKGFAGNAAKYTANAAAAIATVGAAMTAATVAIVKSSAESNRALINQSELARATASEFKAVSLAAKAYGIEQEQVASIMLDLNDKIGDFLTTGAGGMVDFFEQVAPKVGVTADQFKRLSGPEALQLYIDSLQKANLSQAEMTFQLQALGSDAAMLLPLLRDNGASLKELTDQAREMNLVLSDVEIQQLANATKTFDNFGNVVDSVTDRFALQFAPILDVVNDRIVDLSKESNGFEGVVLDVADTVIGAAGFIADAFRGINVVFNLLEVGAKGFAFGTVSILRDVSEGIDFLVNTGIDGINSLIEAANRIPGVDLETFVTGESGATASLKAMESAIKESLEGSVRDFNELINQPMPSDAFDRFIEDVRAKSEEAADEAVQARHKALGLDDESIEQDGERMKSRFQILQEIEGQGQEGLTEAMAEAKKRREKNAAEEQAEKLRITQKGLSNLSTLMNVENKRLFEVGKVAAIANATLSGYEAVVHSYNAGSKIGGPVVGAAFAATAGVATAAQISQIASTSYGGGAGGAVSAGAGASSQSPAQAPAQQQERQVANITLVGGDSATFTGEQVRNMLEGLNEQIGNGARLRVS